jgi:hypothetical protein
MDDAEVSRYVARIGELEGQLEHERNRVALLVKHVASLTKVVRAMTVYLEGDTND